MKRKKICFALYLTSVCPIRSAKNSWRYKMLICRRKSDERESPNLLICNPFKIIFIFWRGDITTLRCDAIVNAANSQMLGCFVPCHSCIDNCIHTYAGVQLRSVCAERMRKQGHEEKIGTAKLTPAYNLPCQYVLHTVGPVIYGRVTNKDKELLASCYRSCLELARTKWNYQYCVLLYLHGRIPFSQQQSS